MMILEIAAGIVLGLLIFLVIYNYWQVLLGWALILVVGLLGISAFVWFMSWFGPAWKESRDNDPDHTLIVITLWCVVAAVAIFLTCKLIVDLHDFFKYRRLKNGQNDD